MEVEENGGNEATSKRESNNAATTSERNVGRTKSNVPQDPPDDVNGELIFPPELLPQSPGIDMVVGREPWHRQVPSDWVPIITRDMQAQMSTSRDGPGGPLQQAPFSDAYISTQPAKKRRLASEGKPEGSIEKVIKDTLKDAIRASGVQPIGSNNQQHPVMMNNSTAVSPGSGAVAVIEQLLQDAASDVGVQDAVKNDTRTAIKRRLQQDPDFKPQNFPNSQDFTSKE